jgi:flavin reductase (DIM6/NTAB) family NADH-FMN oxidoreductase RutF
MTKISCGPQTIVHPHPVLVIGTYDKEGKANIMTASWGGICCSQPPAVAVSLREATQTYHNIMERKAFTVNIPSEKYVKEADYAGIVSGKNVDKFKATGLTAEKSEVVDAPYVKEFPFCLECRLLKDTKIGLHTQFIGEILDVKADADVVTKKIPDIEKVRPLLWGGFGSSHYYGIGKKLADAFSVGEELK